MSRSRKRQRNKNSIGWMIVPAVLLLCVAGFSVWRLSKAAREGKREPLQAEAEILKAAEQKKELEPGVREGMKKPMVLRVSSEAVGPGVVSGKAEKEAAESRASSVPAGSTAGETASRSEKLFSLSGYRAGDQIPAEKLSLESPELYFSSREIQEGDAVYQRINGKSYQKNDNISLSSLCYLTMLHYDFEGQIRVGEMIVNKAIREDVLEIFTELFRNHYEINSMHLIDNYWTGDGASSDSASIDANNTSAFCYRAATGSGKLSNHAYGLAIDINPQQNPYVSYSTGSPRWSHSNADGYIDRTSGAKHMITHEDLAYKLFKEHGFRWGGDWKNIKDYQHFDKI